MAQLTITRRAVCAFFICAALLSAMRAPSRAASTPTIDAALGVFVPTSTSSTVEQNFPIFPGSSVTQSGNVGLEVSMQPHFIFGNYQISGLFLSQHEAVSGGIEQPTISETITQVPVMIEDASGLIGPVKLGGGLGYDFVSYPGAHGSSAGSGVLGDTFVQIGLGSGTALEAKYFFGERSALSGVFAGIAVKL